MKKMPNFFTGVLDTHQVLFQHYGMEWRTQTSANSDDTITKLAENLNHFLMYYAMRDEQEYQNICQHITRTMNQISNEALEMRRHPEKTLDVIIRLCKQYGPLDDYLLDRICRYVKDCVVENIDESKATTSITLRNIDADILACVSVAIKFDYLYMGLFRGNMIFDATIPYYQDALLFNISRHAQKYFTFPENGYDVPDYVDGFFHDLIEMQWSKHDRGFIEKFENIGRDVEYHVQKDTPIILSSLKKFGVRVHDEELERTKYADELMEHEGAVYYRVDVDDWDDFKFVNMNMIGWIQTTTKRIIGGQNTPIKIADTNSPDFLVDNTADRSLRKDVSFYMDDMKHLYELRKGTSESLFRMFMEELNKIDEPLGHVRLFRIHKHHLLNQFILRKTLLCLTGEGKVYSDILGMYAKFILLLFYQRVWERKELESFRPYVKAMMADPGVLELCTPEQAAVFLQEKEQTEEHPLQIPPEAFSQMVKIYSMPLENDIHFGKEETYRFLQFWESPERVRHFYFPDIYTDEEEQDTHRTLHPLANPEFLDQMFTRALEGVPAEEGDEI